MERSEETLSTRDLAETNEPAADRGAVTSDGDAVTADRDPVTADRDPVTDSTRGGAEEETVYDQERAGHGEPVDDIPAGERPGTGTAGEAGRSGTVAPPAVGEATPAAEGQDTLGTTARRDQDLATTAGPGTTGTAAGGAAGSATAESNGDAAPLLSSDASSSFQMRWEEVQTRFVDEPRGAVEAADGLVANLMKELAEGFAQERERLEAQWDRGEDISTEDLRVALQRYRSFFHRLLAA